MCQSDHPNCERNARPYAEDLFKAEFLLFSMGPWALSFYDRSFFGSFGDELPENVCYLNHLLSSS